MRSVKMFRGAACVTIGSLILASVGALPAAIAAQEYGRLAFEAYTVRTYDGRQRQVELGRLAVPESRGHAAGKTVTLGFLRLKSTSPSPGSPVVFLMGGPGIPATVMAPIPPYWDLFEQLRAVGDVILLDQRGVGLSTPDLNCPKPSSPPDPSLFTSRAALAGAFRTVLASCASILRSRGIDPNAYTDDASADDIDDVRRAVGAERVSLLAFSYGTRLALDFAQRHPASLDRLVLQGVEDPNLRYRSSSTTDALFMQYAGLAAADSATAAFAADLPRRLAALFTSLDRAPVVMDVRTPSGGTASVWVGKEGMQAVISKHVSNPRLPALIATLERGDARILTPFVTAMYDQIAGGGGSLMGPAIECSSLPSAGRVDAVDTASKRTLFGPLFDNVVVTPAFCAAIGFAAPERSPDARVASGGAALIIEGTLDDRTGGNAAAIARSLAGSVTLLVENGAHELLPVPQVQHAVVDFLAGQDVRTRTLSADLPRFLSIEAALKPLRRPGS
jgi:pimeloyl-ACP methyl ester carboxylesterase